VKFELWDVLSTLCMGNIFNALVTVESTKRADRIVWSVAKIELNGGCTYVRGTEAV
jgi:hypothetical protein